MTVMSKYSDEEIRFKMAYISWMCRGFWNMRERQKAMDMGELSERLWQETSASRYGK